MVVVVAKVTERSVMSLSTLLTRVGPSKARFSVLANTNELCRGLLPPEGGLD